MRKLLLTFLFGGLLSTSLLSQIDTKAEEQPYFMGCTDYQEERLKRQCSNENLILFIQNNLQYPEAGRELRTEGTVIISFVVNADGDVEDSKVEYDIGSGCGAEALRVVNNMPRWEPGRYAGQAVPVRLEVPIQFSLSEAGPSARIFWGKLHRDTLSYREVQDLIAEPIIIRDQLGDQLHPQELSFIYERKGKAQEATSRGGMNQSIERLLKRVKPESELLIQAMVQKEGIFFPVQRKIQITL